MCSQSCGWKRVEDGSRGTITGTNNWPYCSEDADVLSSPKNHMFGRSITSGTARSGGSSGRPKVSVKSRLKTRRRRER